MTASFKPASIMDIDKVRCCAELAYRPYVAILGVEPAPLKADYANLVRDGNVEIICGYNNAFVGFIVTLEEPDCLLIDNVAIMPEYQRRGILVEVSAYLFKKAKDKKLGHVRAFTNQKLSRNVDMYQRLGMAVDRIEEMSDRVAVHFRCDINMSNQDLPALARRILRDRVK